MRIVYGTVAAFVLVWLGMLFLIPCDIDIVRVYQDKMQVPLFTGFLTIGGFLLTLKTFILIKLKEGLSDREDYKDRIERKRALQPSLSHYGPLRRLSVFLVYGVASALVTAISQLTIGFVPHRAASTLCMASGLLTGALVVAAWWLIKANLQDWFDLLEGGGPKPHP